MLFAAGGNAHCARLDRGTRHGAIAAAGVAEHHALRIIQVDVDGGAGLVDLFEEPEDVEREHRVEVAARPAGGERVVAGVDEVGTDLGGGDIVQKLDYLTIPVMLRYQPVPVFNIHAGPQFGMLLSAKTEYDGDSQDTKDNYKGMDLGLGFGAGVDLPMGLGLSARYVIGISDVAEEMDGGSDEGKVTNSAIQLSVTYKLFGK